MKKRLMILEVSQKQSYIFASKKLRENAVRSEHISYVTGTRFFESAARGLYQEKENLVYSGGGHTVLQFDSREDADAFARTVTEKAMTQFPGMELFVKQMDYDAARTPGQNLKTLSAALERKKAVRQASFRQLSFGLEQTADAAESTACIGAGIQMPENWVFPSRFEELSEKDAFIAVIHADGNGMGRRVEQIYEKCGDWASCCRTLRRFSEGIQQDFERAFRATVEAVIAQGYPAEKLPIRPVVLAGDDVCFVTAGNIGLECARVFLEKLSEMENREQPEQPYAACAGVAIVHKKYPFHQAYALAEELCSSAKRFGAEIDSEGRVSALDWHIVFGQLKDGLSAQREDYRTEDGCRMELRPVTVQVPKGVDSEKLKRVTEGRRTYGFFKEMQRAMKDEYGKIARSKIKELRTAVKQGWTATEFFLHDRQIGDLRYHSFSAKYRTEEERKTEYKKLIDGEISSLQKDVFTDIDGVTRCLFFDAVEMIDHFEPFEEVKS